MPGEATLETKPRTLKFKDLVSGKDHFYLMHMNHWYRSREEEMWDFARSNNVIGLDHVLNIR